MHETETCYFVISSPVNHSLDSKRVKLLKPQGGASVVRRKIFLLLCGMNLISYASVSRNNELKTKP